MPPAEKKDDKKKDDKKKDDKKKDEKKDDEEDTTADQEQADEPAPAIIEVTLPADARLYFNNQPTAMDTDLRRFESPVLEPGMVYQYTLRAELVVDGQNQVKTRTVKVRAGEKTTVVFPFPASVANK
jgi:uncharacterized protein (TIGR03000 family)